MQNTPTVQIWATKTKQTKQTNKKNYLPGTLNNKENRVAEVNHGFLVNHKLGKDVK